MAKSFRRERAQATLLELGLHASDMRLQPQGGFETVELMLGFVAAVFAVQGVVIWCFHSQNPWYLEPFHLFSLHEVQSSAPSVVGVLVFDLGLGALGCFVGFRQVPFRSGVFRFWSLGARNPQTPESTAPPPICRGLKNPYILVL